MKKRALNELICLDRAADLVSGHFISLISLCGGPRRCKGRDVHQIVGDDSEADPAVHAVFSMITTAVDSVGVSAH